MGASEYHIEVLYQLAKFAPDRDVLRGGPLQRSNSLERGSSKVSEAATLAVITDTSTPLERVMRVICVVLGGALLLTALVFPTVFFAYLVYVGAEHGSDDCPHDIDGLLTWFGILGLAFLAVDCAEGAVGPDTGSDGLDGMEETRVADRSWWGSASFLFRSALIVFPWIGTAWTFNLNLNNHVVCGFFLWSTSATVWPSLLVLEILLAFRFCWNLAVLFEHETSLRHLLKQPEPAVRTPNQRDRRAQRESSPHGSSPGVGLEDVPIASGS